jgi:hypothetical protein
MASTDNPAATMSDDATRTLLCLIGGESTPFEVTAPGNARISRLKELILEKGIRASQGILAKSLLLFEVSTFLCFSRQELSGARGLPHQTSTGEPRSQQSHQGHSQNGAKELEEWKRVFHYWKPSFNDMLHVFVKIPAAGEWGLLLYIR